MSALALASCASDDGGTDNARAPGVLKVIVDDHSWDAELEVRASNAVVGEIDYGSFRLLLTDEARAGGRNALGRMGLDIRDDLNHVLLEGVDLDTRRAGDAEATLAPTLRRDELLRSRADGRPPRDGLYLVQFVGPMRDEWVRSLLASGIELVSYVPENAFVVRARGSAAAALPSLGARHPEVQFVGDYHPAYRLTQGLRTNVRRGAIDVTVQVVDGPDAAAALADLKGLAVRWVQDHQVMNFRNVEMSIDAARLQELAAKEYVFHVEERFPRRILDEAQGQIVAGNLSGTQPTGPGYLQFLADHGFTSSQFSSFAVNVVDDASFLTGHPDLPSSRIAFQNNPTAQTGAVGGHGFLNANIVAGFNSSTGTAFEDALGFNYGLGIAPFARVGSTAIFGNGAATPTAWESAAYGQGSRISSNSWGFIGAFRYDVNAQEFDRIVRDAQTTAGLQELIVVFAAGNDGSGANTVSSPGTAKNVITVGASENTRQTGADGCGIANTGADSANDIISFSSRGPVNSAGGDGRVKPDIMAPGTHVEAGIPQSNYDGSSVCNQFFPAGQTLYGWSSGTSHSCPAVAGAAALVFQDFLNRGRPVPSPAMTKAYLSNSATYMTGVGGNGNLPSNNQGMGRMNLGVAFDTASRILVDQTQVLGTTGQTFTISGNIVSSTQPFRVSLAWTDAPGPTTGAPWVNNLDLEVTVNGTLFRGNVFSGASSATGGVADPRNNMESVFLPAGTTGSFTITVRGTNIAGDGVPGNADTTDQDFALVVYNGTQAVGAPTIGVSPASLSFSGAAGGANPASQSLSVTNTGGGTLSFTASTNQPWLAVSPGSGTAPATLAISVNTAGLAPGTFTGAVTITSAGATNSPLSVPVTLTVVANNQPPTVSITSPTSGSTVSGTITVSANASDPDGTIASVTFALPDGTTVTDTTAPFSTTFDTTRVANGAGKTITATATDNVGATASASVTFTIDNGIAPCINGTFTSTDVPRSIPDNNATGITSVLPVTGNGAVGTLSLSLNITHTFRGDLVVTLISPAGTQFIVSNRAGGSADNIVIVNQAITVFNGQTAAGTWSLRVQDLAGADLGTLNSWSLNIVGNCTPVVHWSGSATPNLPTIDNSTACTSLTVATTGGASSAAKLDISGSHAFRSILRGTLAHNGVTVAAFPVGTFPANSGTFSFTNRAVPGLSGDSSGTWTLCIVDTDAFGDTGVLNTWSVHD